MKATCSLTTLLFIVLLPALAAGKEAPPVPYHGAPLIPWAKKVDEHRFRSPRDYEGTLRYYAKTVLAAGQARREKICNTTEVRAVYLRALRNTSRWEGINIYEVKGTTYLYVILSESELERMEKKKQKRAGKGKRSK